MVTYDPKTDPRHETVVSITNRGQKHDNIIEEDDQCSIPVMGGY